VMRQFIEEERKLRKIKSDFNAWFLDWKEDRHTQPGMSTLIATTRGA
jgi:hypothetical protein